MTEPPTPGAELPEQLRAVLAGIQRLEDHTAAATAMIGISILDLILEKALRVKMRPLSNRMHARLFKGYGPLYMIAAKIDLVYALSIVSVEMYKDMIVMNKIRVQFAHSTKFKKFSDPNVKKLFNGFSDFKSDEQDLDLFYVTVLKRVEGHIVTTLGIEPP